MILIALALLFGGVLILIGVAFCATFLLWMPGVLLIALGGKMGQMAIQRRFKKYDAKSKRKQHNDLLSNTIEVEDDELPWMI